ncbi:phage portal protein [Enterococcus sp. DIV0800]|uniref:phage portal protein n=1 Tax=unclassified Enterococcus TaxID=2608891 RepID=UPI003D2FF45E
MANEIKFLAGQRFNLKANEVFRMAQEDFDAIDFESKSWIEQLERFISRHKNEQVERLQELKRYSLSDNNIKYRSAKTDDYAADNRIASDFARYITIFEQGYMLGKPVQYKNEDTAIQNEIEEFSIENNEAYHNILIKTDLSIYGRAYEMLTVDMINESATVKLVRLNPEQTFVVYDDTYNNNSLFGVRYYRVDYGDGKWKDFVIVYCADYIYYYVNDNQKTDTGLVFDDFDDHNLNGVPINEYANNEDRTGAYEPVLDTIDAYDLSQSELANFQQDMMDAMLVITGNPYTGTDDNDFDENGNINQNSKLGVTMAFKRARVMILDDNPNPEGANPNAFYLVKQYDADGAEVYKKRLVSDILRFTFTPDMTDEHFSGNQSGEALKYKLMAADNRRAMQERQFEKGLMRRLRLAVNIWRIKGNETTAYDSINKTNVVFTPNVPKSDADIVNLASSLLGQVSDQTIVEILSTVTGIDPDEELARMKEEQDRMPDPRIAKGEEDSENE